MRKKRNAEKGFTLAEVLIAVTILTVAAVPILSTFVVSARLNMRGRQKEQAMTIAENIVEGVKSVGVVSAYDWCTSSTAYSVIPENAGSVSMSRSATSTPGTATVDMSGYVLTNKTLGPEYSAVEIDTTSYVYNIKNILMGSTYFDATVTVNPITTDMDYLASYVYSADYNDAGMNILKYYAISVSVTLHDESTVMAEYSGTIITQN